MKKTRIVFSLFALLVLSVAASAQTAPGKGRVAVINTTVFQEKIAEFKAKIDALNKQFEPRVRDLEQLGQRIQQMENTIQNGRGTLTPAKIAELSEQMEGLKKEYQRKGEDLQVDGNRAREQSLQPVSAKLERFARDYTTRKGIAILFDLANAVNSNLIVWYDAKMDVTEDFITEYNKANPSTAASTTPPKPQ
jgi:Skp family chaperone for outer membrane proteins